MRAELASRRSIEATRRPNRPVDGAKVAAAVLGISVSFHKRGTGCAVDERQSRYTRCQKVLVCLHSSNLTAAMQHTVRSQGRLLRAIHVVSWRLRRGCPPQRPGITTV